MDITKRMDTAELAETLDGVAELLDRCASGGEPIDTKVAATMLAATMLMRPRARAQVERRAITTVQC